MSDRVAGGNRYAGLDTPVKLGSWLRARVKEYGVPVSEVADDIGVAPGTIYNWLKGRLPRLPRDGETDKFEDGLLAHPALALSCNQREHLADQRRVLIGAAADVAAEKSRMWPQRDLPAGVATFTGRYAQLDQLNRLLVRKERGHAVVISALTGMGGVGKTALAVHWAQATEVRRTFPDGAVHVNLNGFSETEPVTTQEAQARLLRQLGVKPRALPLDADALSGLYHETLTGKSMLLLLDNARDEPQVRPLLPKDARCLALVTSRNRLTGLTVSHDATCLNLDALTPRESARLLRRLLGGVADREPEAVETLAAACAHLPLALRIAAADYLAAPRRVSLGEYVAELAEDRLGKLAIGSTDPATAVKSVLDRSYRNLSRDARRALRLLSCHPGTDWDCYAVAALLDTDLGTAETQLHALRDHSLLDAFGAPVGQRYRMHDLTAEYARVHPDTESRHRERALGRLWNYYRRAAGLAMDHFAPHDKQLRPTSPRQQGPCPNLSNMAQAMDWLDAERANLLISATYCAKHGDFETVHAVAATIYRYLEQQGHWRDGSILHRLECEHADPANKGRALARLGVMRQKLGSLAEAHDLHEQALTVVQQIDDRTGEINVLVSLGIDLELLGRLDDAVDRYSQAVAAARADGNDLSLGRALGNLANVHKHRGDHDLAIECHQKALAAARAAGNRTGEAHTLNNLGCVHEAKGDLTEAAKHYRLGLDLARHIGSKTIEPHCLVNLGSVSEQNGDTDEALRYYDEALRLAERFEDRAFHAEVLNNFSRLFHRLQRHDDAISHAEEALVVATAVGRRFEKARAHDNIAQSFAAQGNTDASRHHWVEALRIFENLDTPETEDIKRLLANTGPEVTGDVRD